MTGDERWMMRALELAERGRGWVEPNPLVGAVVVRDGVLVGEGWHEKFGGPHAEVNALRTAAHSGSPDGTRGATLFVTLEPCCHTGKTPPCTHAILRAGIKQVVLGMLDPFPEVAGKGIEQLRSGGVAVDVGGVFTAMAEEINRPYLTLIRRGRPYVHAKWAMSLDGKIATRTGDSKWISGPAARELVHKLRGRMDAIIVGAGTVRADDPLLTARPPGPRTPARIVLTGSAPIPDGCRLFATAAEATVTVVTSAGAKAGRGRQGCEILELPGDGNRPSIAALLHELGRRRMTNVLVEGGAAVLGSFHDAGLIDELHIFVAPKVIGGTDAPSPVGGTGMAAPDGGRKPEVARWEQLGGDFYVGARFPLADEPS